MDKIQFGTTPLKVSPVVFGTWVTGGWAWGGADHRQAVDALVRGFELGINFVDTAPVYGFGCSEERVGEALRRWSGEDIVVATKCGLEWDQRQVRIRRNASPQRILFEVDQSLRRLGLDCIDLYQVHWPDPNTPFEATMETMLRLQEAGKIRAIGVSNFNVEQIKACRRFAPVVSLQPPYNIFEREAETELLPYCRRQGMATMVYGGLCRGLLSGKFRGDETFVKGDLRRGDPKFKPDKFRQYVKAVDAMKKIAAAHGKTMAQFALRWALQQPGVTTVIAGARTVEQVEDNAGAAGWEIGAAELKQVDEILQRHIKTPVGPGFMAPSS